MTYYSGVSLDEYMNIKTRLERVISGLITFHRNNGAVYDNLVTDVTTVMQNAENLHMVSNWSHVVQPFALEIKLAVGNHKCTISFMLPHELHPPLLS